MRAFRWLWCALVFPAVLGAHEAATPALTQAANAFFHSLREEQQAVAVYPFNDDERYDWGFVPRPRQGIPLRDLDPLQRDAVRTLVQATLSTRGAAQAEAIMALETVLRELEGASYRDPERYYVTFFGEPGLPPWAWRLEGHHLSLNVTIPTAEEVVVTPNFFGANPATVPSGPHAGQRTLAAEEDLARQLVRSLDAAQRQQAIFSTRAPRDILTGDEARVAPLEPAGLPAQAMTESQRAILDQLLEVYLGRFAERIAAPTRARLLGEGSASLHFAWAGGLAAGEGHYYRIQGPTFVIEYDNTQDGANHIHTTWRDFDRDFGRDLLREHYKAAHGERD